MNLCLSLLLDDDLFLLFPEYSVGFPSVYSSFIYICLLQIVLCMLLASILCVDTNTEKLLNRLVHKTCVDIKKLNSEIKIFRNKFLPNFRASCDYSRILLFLFWEPVQNLVIFYFKMSIFHNHDIQQKI